MGPNETTDVPAAVDPERQDLAARLNRVEQALARIIAHEDVVQARSAARVIQAHGPGDALAAVDQAVHEAVAELRTQLVDQAGVLVERAVKAANKGRK
jgi:hypothetical protein